MTDEEINKAIAEACGWKLLANNRWTKPCGIYADLPNYAADLNAMHEAEKVLTEEQFYEYGANLDKITLPKNKMEMCYVHCPEAGMYRELVCATATQRAEAFLKTLDLWEQ